MQSETSWLNSASREEKARLARYLLRLKSQKDQDRLKNFFPNPGFQEDFIRSRAKVRMITAGNQSGKTHVGAWEHATYAMGQHPYKKIRTPNVGFIVTAKPHAEGIEKDILPKLLEVVGSRDILSIKNNSRGTPFKILWRSGSVSFLMSAEQEDIVFEGTTLHHAWLDEPSRRAIYIGLKRGMLTTGGHLWYTCTPLDEPWLYDEIYLPGISGKDPEIAIFEGSSDQNRKVTQKEKDEFLKTLTADEIETRWHGKFRHLTGRVFKEYRPEICRVPSFDVPPHWPVWISIDPHRNKPHAVLFLAVSPQGLRYVCNEIFIACTINELAEYILDIGEQYNVVERLIDTSAQDDGWERVSARQMLQDRGVRTKLAQKKNLKASGIQLINQGFHDQTLFVMEHCVRTHKELMLQTYKKNKRDEQVVLEEPEKKWDDMTDNMRYILVEEPTYGGIATIKDYGPVYQRGRY